MAWKNGTPPNRWAKRPISGVAEQLDNLPKPEVLGTVKDSILNPRPDVDWATRWVAPDGTVVDLTQPPPWAKEVLGKGRSESDARTFVDVPDDWVLRWQNPKRIDQHGFRGWLPVMTSHPLVKLKVPQMRDASNNVRMGLNGDLLTFMPRSWYEARVAEKHRDVQRKSQSAKDLQDRFHEDAARGKFGKGIRPGWSDTDRGKFPTQTQFVAKSGEHT